MPRTIHKYKLDFSEFNRVTMPVDATLLSVQMQGNQLCLWAMIDKEQMAVESRAIGVFGTGHELPETRLIFITTFQLPASNEVYHVFEKL
jgi:hypothetical protein